MKLIKGQYVMLIFVGGTLEAWVFDANGHYAGYIEVPRQTIRVYDGRAHHSVRDEAAKFGLDARLRPNGYVIDLV
jgi:hypothetical protein